jgi:hypothetical protein
MTKKAVIEQLVRDFGKTPDHYGAWRKKDALIHWWSQVYREATGRDYKKRK